MAIGALKNWKLIAGGLAIVAIISIIGATYWHYTGLLSTVSTLERANTIFNIKIASQEKQIVAQQTALEEWKANEVEILNRLRLVETISKEARVDTRKLQELFSKHDLTKLAQK